MACLLTIWPGRGWVGQVWTPIYVGGARRGVDSWTSRREADVEQYMGLKEQLRGSKGTSQRNCLIWQRALGGMTFYFLIILFSSVRVPGPYQSRVQNGAVNTIEARFIHFVKKKMTPLHFWSMSFDRKIYSLYSVMHHIASLLYINHVWCTS